MLQTPSPPRLSAIDRNWLERALAFASWCQTQGRLPRQSGTDEPVEKVLGRWLATQRRVAAGKRLSVATTRARLAWLDRHVPIWRSDHVRLAGQKRKTHRTFDARLLALSRFVAKQGHLPRTNGSLRNEAWLAAFLANCRSTKAYPKLTEGQTARIDRVAPGWR